MFHPSKVFTCGSMNHLRIPLWQGMHHRGRIPVHHRGKSHLPAEWSIDPKCSTLHVGSSDTNIRTRSTNCRNHIYEPSTTVVKWPLTLLNIKASKPCLAWMGVRIRRESNCHTTINWMIKQSSYWLAKKFILQMQPQRRKESWLLNQKADGS